MTRIREISRGSAKRAHTSSADPSLGPAFSDVAKTEKGGAMKYQMPQLISVGKASNLIQAKVEMSTDDGTQDSFNGLTTALEAQA